MKTTNTYTHPRHSFSGRGYNCKDCGENFENRESVYYCRYESGDRELLCKGCVDKDWLSTAQYIFTKEGY